MKLILLLFVGTLFGGRWLVRSLFRRLLFHVAWIAIGALLLHGQLRNLLDFLPASTPTRNERPATEEVPEQPLFGP